MFSDHPARQSPPAATVQPQPLEIPKGQSVSAEIPTASTIQIAGRLFHIGNLDLKIRNEAEPYRLCIEALYVRGGNLYGKSGSKAKAEIAALLLKHNAPDVTVEWLLHHMTSEQGDAIMDEFTFQAVVLAT